MTLYIRRFELQDGAQANGNGSPGYVDGLDWCVFQIFGTFTATVNFEGSIDGESWTAIRAEDLSAGTFATSSAGAGLFQTNCAGLSYVRARVSGYASGAVNVLLNAVK